MEYPLNVLCPRFKLDIQPKEGTRYNPLHDEANGCIASVLDIEVGKRGWINYMTDDYLWEHSWHRIHTSMIEKIDIGYDNDSNCINKLTIITLNTVYTLTKI